jgi:hypothetical protein
VARVTYNVPHPIQPVDGIPVYVKAKIQRAPDAAGTPGAWGTIATVTGSTTGKWFYRFEDDASPSTLDAWYRHIFTDLAEAADADPSEEVQVDEFLAILWALADITDDDVSIDAVTQWANQGVADLWPRIWQRYPASAAERTAATILPDDVLVAGTNDEHYPIPSDLFEVWRVEKIDATSFRHIAWLFSNVEWEQADREIRLMNPSETYRYRMHGKKRYRDLAEVGEELYQLIYWQIRKQYLDWRVNKRANTPRFLVFDRKSDTTPEQLRDFLDEAIAQVDRRISELTPQEFPVDIAYGVAL